MTLVELEHRLAARLDLDAEETSRVVRAFLAAVAEQLASGGEVKLLGFGRFDVRQLEARRRKDPRNGRDFDAPAKMKAVFRPSRLLLEQLNRDGDR